MLNWITGVIENVLDFSNVLNISITASWVVLAVLLVRFALKKAPKWIHVALWGIVAVRLLLPFSIESVFSLLPSKETVPSHLMQAQGTQLHDSAHLDIISNPYFPGNVSLELSQSTDRVQISMMLMTFVWLAGIAAMLIYTDVSYIRLRQKVSTAVLLRDNIYQSENVTSPFVLGLLRPTVYIPFKVDGQSLEHIIAHEQAHICRRDYIWKLLGFLLLTIHWFNPVMWVAYILLCRDIELACDEAVIKNLGNEQRADYSQALLDCSVNRWAIAACPLAFGEVGVKERVTSVLNYKKPAFWLIIAAVIVCAVVAVCFLTEPYSSKILYNSRVYQQSGASVEILPENSEQVGTLIGIAHRTSDDPEKEFHATNLDEKYAGCPVYQSGADKGTIYLYDYEGFYIPFVVVVEPGIVNPWVQEYIPGTGNILGSVDKEKYESISEDFAIGADRYGRAVFKNPYKAYDTFVELYAEGIALIREEHNLPAMTSKRYDMYKVYGWQTTTGSAEAQAQASFVSSFLDIYENSFDKDVPNMNGSTPTAESAPVLSLNDVIILSQKGYELTWEDFSGYEYTDTGSGLYIHSYFINDMFSLDIGGGSTEGQPMYIYLNANDGTGERIDIRDGGVTEFIERHREAPGGIDYSAMPNEDFPLEGDYLTLHQAIYCINYARNAINHESLNLPESERVESVFCFPYSSHSTGECTYFGSGSPCDEWKENQMHPYPFHSDGENFMNYEPRPVWEICVSYPESEANATEIIYVDAQTGDMYNPTNRGGYFPSPFTTYSEYARLLSADYTDNTTTDSITVPTNSALNEPSGDTVVMIREYMPDVYVDLKYASTENFTGQVIYDFSEPSLRYGTVKKLYLVQQELLELGYSLKIWDAYRPFGVHEKLWNICPDPKYVSDPSSGNLSHCRGNAIDVTLVLADGSEIEMPTGFDDFSDKADRDYSDVSSAAKDNALLLQRTMEKYGFKGYNGEWWHYADSEDYEIIR